jgi:pilus assembly protein CpaB
MRRPTLFVVLAGLAAMLASVVVYSALKRREAEVQQAIAKTVEVVVASYDLPLGTKIEPGEVKMTRWASDSLPAGAYTDPKQVYGTFVKSSFVANEPIVANKLFLGEKTAGVMPLLIPFGMRAVSVPVDEVSDIAGFVLPHTRVDVLVAISGGEGSTKPFSKVVLQNVEVLAVAQEVEKKKDEPTVVKVVTLLVTPQEAERVALATREGTLRLAMRNYNDNKIVFTAGTDIPGMLRAYAPPPEVPVMAAQPVEHHAPVPRTRPFEVEILRNGTSSESVSFLNEATLSKSDVPDGAPHKKAARRVTKEETSADASVPPATAADTPPSSAGSAHDDANHHDSGANGAPAATDESNSAPGSGDLKPAAYAPTPKTIDIP